jgi:hypothetical protein
MNDQELQWAVDELQIRNVLASLALVSDMGDLDDWGMLFTEDAMYSNPVGEPERGRAEIVESARKRRSRGTHGPGSGNRHFSGSVRVWSTGPDTAEADSYLLMFKDLVPEGETQPSPTLLVVGYYHDELRRTSDGWKVAHRNLRHTSQTRQWRDIVATWTR